MQPVTRLTLFALIVSLTLNSMQGMESAQTVAPAVVETTKDVVKVAVETAKDVAKEVIPSVTGYHIDNATFTGPVTINPAATPAKSEVVKEITGSLARKIAAGKDILIQHKWSTALGVAGVAFIMYCIFRFNCKDPKKECVNRYSLAFKDLKLRSVEDINGLQEQIRYIVKNIHYIIEDGIIGRPGNSSPSIRVDTETWKVNAKEYCPYQGVFGWIHAYSKPLVTTLKFPYEAGKVALTTVAGLYVLANLEQIVNAIENTNYGKTVTDFVVLNAK